MEASSALSLQPVLNFLFFVLGVLLFQSIYMLVMYVITRRSAFLWYVGYLLCAVFMSLKLLHQESNVPIELSIGQPEWTLFLLSMCFYWVFWQRFFEIRQADKWAYRLVWALAGYYAFWMLLGWAAVVGQLLLPYYEHWYKTLIFLPQGVAVWLFIYTYRSRNKLLSLLLIAGSAISTVFTFLFEITGPKADAEAGLHVVYFFSGYVAETFFLSAALAYRTQFVFQRNARLETRMVEANLAALRAQLNPHFIFNGLNAINRFVLNGEDDAASHYLVKFARLIRSLLRQSREQTVSLEEELGMLRQYLEMESLRFSHNFDYSIHLSPEIDPEKVQIPSMLLQPFVENALYHGLFPKSGARKLEVRVHQQGKLLYIAISDNGIGRTQAAGRRSSTTSAVKPLGLKITRERAEYIEALTGKIAGFEIIDLVDANGAAAGTRVEFRLGV